MYIQQNKPYQFEINRYYPLDITNQYPIMLVARFFHDGFNHIHLFGTIDFIEKLKNHERSGMCFEIIEFTIDSKSNLVYVSEIWRDSTQEITLEIDQLIEENAVIELCHRNFIKYTVMTEENLYHLLLTWDKLVEELVPFILIYQDDEGWYDSLGFQTQEAMKQFVADHTKSE